MRRITKLALFSIAMGLIALLSVQIFSPPQQPTTPTSSTVQKQPKPDWTLSIPEIDFEQQMSPITKQGTELPVPDSSPGYYLDYPGNIFIVGHNNSVFPRLKELPTKILIYRNNLPTEYTLKDFQTLPVGQIKMNSLLQYQGVVIMTCAGERLADTYSHRLILYYI